MFEILFHTRAQKAYDRLDAKRRRQINRGIDSLRTDPLGAPNVKPLHGEFSGLCRLRVGDYRVVFEARSSERKVFILAIGSRGDVYK